MADDPQNNDELKKPSKTGSETPPPDVDQFDDYDDYDADYDESGMSNDALLRILQEKDKIILSLKEASTQRDKGNEYQIRVLSEDNEKKGRSLSRANRQLQDLQNKYTEAASELAIHRERAKQYGMKLDELQGAVHQYKKDIADSLDRIGGMVNDELGKRQERNDELTERLQQNYRSLEDKLAQVDQQYRNLLQVIAQKQVKAKSFIRKSLQNLQEGLNLLDINSTQLMVDNRVFDEFSSIVQDSKQSFQELQSGAPAGSTIIKNIENVHLQLTETPKLDSFFNELNNLAPDEEGRPKEEEEETGEDQPAPGTPPEIPSDEEMDQLLEEEDGDEEDATRVYNNYSGPPPAEGGGGGAAPPGGSPQGGGEQPPSGQQTAPGGPGGPGGLPQDMTINTVPQGPQTIKSDEDLIMRESPNLAPYNWDQLPANSPLLRFRELLNNARRYEKEGKFIKALDIYQAVKEQRTVQEDELSLNMLEDQIESANRLSRAQLSQNAKRRDIENYFKHQGEE